MNAQTEYFAPSHDSNLQEYRQSAREKQRTADLVRLLPRGRHSVLDIGARDGHFSRLLTKYFRSVTALDLAAPAFECNGVRKIAGDVTNLPFSDSSIDCIFCTEVLEHVPNLEKACREISRVARHEVIIGVPYRQDIRVGRTTCQTCGGISPPWGHVNTFDEERLLSLFPELRAVRMSLVGENIETTNALAACLMDLAGNPWGTYEQEEACVHCGSDILAPNGKRSVAAHFFSRGAFLLNSIQRKFQRPRPSWMHMVLVKDRHAVEIRREWSFNPAVSVPLASAEANASSD